MEKNWVLSKFWIRIWAMLIDFIILGIFGFILGIIFNTYFISIGEKAKLIGWLVSLLYFSVLNSKINHGQTFGKKLMRIQVVDIQGKFISLKTSFIRALIFTTPFFLNGLKIKGISTFSPVTIIQAIIIFTIGLGIIVFYIFNKSTRQSVHDIAVKTYVVQDYRDRELSVIPKITKLPYYITGGIFLLVLCGSLYSYNSNSELMKLLSVYKEISEQDHVNNASVNMTYPPGSNQRYFYTVRISIDYIPQDQTINNPQLQEAVKSFIKSSAYESDNDILNVLVVSGYDIGIASKYQSFNFYKPIAEWKKDFNK
ncbi:RDD family protein [Chryseobacterium daeguense]|uniref:RDD family protein n=1 Tax=Chryseobacterium daeguense TaxID=412438 RepID=UPI0004859D83|nr:RDD family protein [Chryseobacterium daeguense]